MAEDEGGATGATLLNLPRDQVRRDCLRHDVLGHIAHALIVEQRHEPAAPRLPNLALELMYGLADQRGLPEDVPLPERELVDGIGIIDRERAGHVVAQQHHLVKLDAGVAIVRLPQDAHPLLLQLLFGHECEAARSGAIREGKRGTGVRDEA